MAIPPPNYGRRGKSLAEIIKEERDKKSTASPNRDDLKGLPLPNYTNDPLITLHNELSARNALLMETKHIPEDSIRLHENSLVFVRVQQLVLKQLKKQ